LLPNRSAACWHLSESSASGSTRAQQASPGRQVCRSHGQRAMLSPAPQSPAACAGRGDTGGCTGATPRAGAPLRNGPSGDAAVSSSTPARGNSDSGRRLHLFPVSCGRRRRLMARGRRPSRSGLTRRVPCPQRPGPRAPVEGFGVGEVSAPHRPAAQAKPKPGPRTTATARAASAGRHGPVPAAGWLPAADAPASPRAAGPQAAHQAEPRRRSGEVPASQAPRRAPARRACPQGRAHPGCRYAPGGRSRPARPQ